MAACCIICFCFCLMYHTGQPECLFYFCISLDLLISTATSHVTSHVTSPWCSEKSWNKNWIYRIEICSVIMPPFCSPVLFILGFDAQYQIRSLKMAFFWRWAWPGCCAGPLVDMPWIRMQPSFSLATLDHRSLRQQHESLELYLNLPSWISRLTAHVLQGLSSHFFLVPCYEHALWICIPFAVPSSADQCIRCIDQHREGALISIEYLARYFLSFFWCASLLLVWPLWVVSTPNEYVKA